MDVVSGAGPRRFGEDPAPAAAGWKVVAVLAALGAKRFEEVVAGVEGVDAVGGSVVPWPGAEQGGEVVGWEGLL